MLFCIIVYFGIGVVVSFDLFLKFYAAILLIYFAATALGFMLSILFNSPEAAVQISPTIILPLSILGGFFTNSGSVPAWIRWM